VLDTSAGSTHLPSNATCPHRVPAGLRQPRCSSACHTEAHTWRCGLGVSASAALDKPGAAVLNRSGSDRLAIGLVALTGLWRLTPKNILQVAERHCTQRVNGGYNKSSLGMVHNQPPGSVRVAEIRSCSSKHHLASELSPELRSSEVKLELVAMNTRDAKALAASLLRKSGTQPWTGAACAEFSSARFEAQVPEMSVFTDAALQPGVLRLSTIRGNSATATCTCEPLPPRC
jgi:hypothetical protein